MWSSPKKIGEPWSQTRRRGCHCLELQDTDEPFPFCGRSGTACVDLLNRVDFSPHMIGFLMPATKQERKSALKRLRCFFQDAQGGAFCKRAEIHCSRLRRSSIRWYSRVTEVGTKRLIHELVKQTQFCASFIAPW